MSNLKTSCTLVFLFKSSPNRFIRRLKTIFRNFEGGSPHESRVIFRRKWTFWLLFCSLPFYDKTVRGGTLFSKVILQGTNRSFQNKKTESIFFKYFRSCDVTKLIFLRFFSRCCIRGPTTPKNVEALMSIKQRIQNAQESSKILIIAKVMILQSLGIMTSQ